MFTFQHNTHFSQAVACSREKFWEEIRLPSTSWNIDSRRAILAAVEQHDEKAIKRWLKRDEYRKFLLKKQNMKKEASRKKFFEKTDEERLLAFAQELKDNLPAFIFSCREFDATETGKGNLFCHRRLADCHLNGLVLLDIDHVDEPMTIWEKLQANDELMKRTGFVHVTSSKRGIRVIFTADIKDGNLADNQIVFAQKLGYKADQSCIDATRNSFAPKEEDILYLNEDLLFEYYDEEFDNRYTQLYRQKETQPLYHEFAAADEKNTDKITQKEPEPLCKKSKADCSDPLPPNLGGYEWRGVSIQKIIDARYAEKLPCAADTNRHAESLKLASDLLVMLDGDKALVQQIVEAQPWVQEIIAERNENVAGTVSSAAERMAANEKKYLTQSPSKAMQAAIKEVTGKDYKEAPSNLPLKGEAQENQSFDSQLSVWGEEIEKMFDKFPLLRDICKGLKRNQYPAAVFVGGGLMMTLMTRCTYRFYHRPEELRRLNNSTLIIGDPASGKSFATRLFKQLAAPIVEADKKGKEAINAYRDLMKTKGANKEKPAKPKVVVRVHPARTSNAQFIQDMVNAKEVVDGTEMQLHMLTFDTELDNTVTVQKGGSWIDKQSLELKAFHNEEDGQAYSNIDSVLQDFYVTWNYIYTGTPIALKKKVNEQNFGSGLATRLTCIPLPATNFEMMEREQDIDFTSDERLKAWAYKLDKTKGELPLQKIVDELYDWTARRMLDAKENESKADEMLLKRCAYHALNFSAPFIVMRHWEEMRQEGDFRCGEFETDDVDWQLAELLVNIQYACQKHYFGAMAEQYFDNQTKELAANTRRQQKTIDAYNRLPEEFTSDDVMRCFGLANVNSASTKLTRLMKDHLIERMPNFVENGIKKGRYKKIQTMIL